MKTLGFIGSGRITEAMVRGLKRSSLADRPILLSPRNASVAARLGVLPGVSVAASNQAVLDGAGLVILALRPQIATEVLQGLRFRPEHQVISLIAGLDHDRIGQMTGVAAVCRAIPLPFVEMGSDATPVFPPRPEALALFAALGQALPVTGKEEFDLYAALSALMGSYFGILETAEAWATGQGLPAAPARAYLASLFSNLERVLQQSDQPLADLRRDHSTAGGLNEQVYEVLRRQGGLDALQRQGWLRSLSGSPGYRPWNGCRARPAPPPDLVAGKCPAQALPITSVTITTRFSTTDFTAASASASAISPSSPVGSALPLPDSAAMKVAISAA